MVPSQEAELAVLQVNLARSYTATSELVRVSEIFKSKILLLQEPYSCVRGGTQSVPGLGPYARVYHHSMEQIMSAIVVLDKAIDAVLLVHLSSQYITAINVSVGQLDIVIVNVYFPPSIDFDEQMAMLESTLDALTGRNILLAGDFNAKSHLWFSTYEDERGRAVSDMISSRDLYVVNQPNNPPTFSTVNGESNIDITFTTGSLLNGILSWKVHTDVISSDHRAITYDIKMSNKYPESASKPKVRTLNADAFLTQLDLLMRDSIHWLWTPGRQHIDYRVNFITQAINSAFRRAVKYTYGKPRYSPWWNDDLSDLKLECNRARRRYQAASADNKENCKHHYRAMYSSYKKKIRLAKTKSWTNFVNNDLGKNPWGFTYKLSRSKVAPAAILSAIETNNVYSTDVQSTLEAVLTRLFPDDDPAEDSEANMNIRLAADHLTGSDQTFNFDMNLLYECAAKIKNYKAPGPDQVYGEALRLAIPIIDNALLDIFNDCITFGYFPRTWKHGNVVTILKSPDKDPTDIKSYRPITLLSELGKLLERMIVCSMHKLNNDLFSKDQFGFTQGKGTTDAIKTVLDYITDTPSKYCVSIFVDISGAFDNLWWPALLTAPQLVSLPNELYNLVRSYLNERSIEIKTENHRAEKTLTKGAPQGSALGPPFWNLAMDQFLRTELPPMCRAVAYADDIVLLVHADNRKTLEERINDCLVQLYDWTSNQKLTISATKTKYMVLKNKLDRNPTVRFHGKPIKRVAEIKYLGIILDDKLLFIKHVNYVSAKVSSIMQLLRRYIRSNWNIDLSNSIRIIYRYAMIPILAYGSDAWEHRLNHSRVIRKLGQAQASALRLVAGAYKTVPNESLCIITKELPMHLELMYKLLCNKLKRNGTATVLDTTVNLRDFQSINAATSHIRDVLIEDWERIWHSTDKGSTLRRFIPDVRPWLESDTEQTNHYATQLLTGHGNFNAYLRRIGKIESDQCEHCSALDDSLHRLFDCQLYADSRASFAQEAVGMIRFPADIITNFSTLLPLAETFCTMLS